MEVDNDNNGSVNKNRNQFTKCSLLSRSTSQYHSQPPKKLPYDALIDIDWGHHQHFHHHHHHHYHHHYVNIGAIFVVVVVLVKTVIATV